MYPGTEVPTIKQIFKMMQTRDWLGGELTATYANATKGLTPYIVGHLTEEAISNINDAEELLERATSTTTADVAATKRKLSLPQCFEKLVRLLKRYTNLLHADFGALCPLSLSIREAIAALEKYSEGAQDSMSERTLASILWTIFKQTKFFAIGKMTGKNPLLPEYSMMLNNIVAKQAIFHCELPEKFLSPTKAKKPKKEGSGGGVVSDEEDAPSGGAATTKKSGKKTAKLHPDILDKLGPIIAKANKNNLILTNVCRACGTSPAQLVPPGMCANTAVLGKCTNKACKRAHTTPSDDQAAQIIKMMEPLIRDPTLLPDAGKYR